MEANSIEKFRIITKQWAKSQDVMSLVGCSKTKAYKIIRELQLQVLREGKKPIAPGVISMDRLIQYLEISKDEIYNAAVQEKNLFGLEGC